MTARHVFLGLVALTAAWRPRETAALLEGKAARRVGAREGPRTATAPRARTPAESSDAAAGEARS